MKKSTLCLLLLGFVSLSARAEGEKKAVPAVEADNEVVEKKVCKKDQESRDLEVIPKDKGCTLVYAKGGKSENVAHASHGVQVCQDTLKKIQARLEKAGFHCE
jgi:hypothetical protein